MDESTNKISKKSQILGEIAIFGMTGCKLDESFILSSIRGFITPMLVANTALLRIWKNTRRRVTATSSKCTDPEVVRSHVISDPNWWSWGLVIRWLVIQWLVIVLVTHPDDLGKEEGGRKKEAQESREHKTRVMRSAKNLQNPITAAEDVHSGAHQCKLEEGKNLADHAMASSCAHTNLSSWMVKDLVEGLAFRLSSLLSAHVDAFGNLRWWFFGYVCSSWTSLFMRFNVVCSVWERLENLGLIWRSQGFGCIGIVSVVFCREWVPRSRNWV